jgi:DNA-binding transcriptional LysR family regulator
MANGLLDAELRHLLTFHVLARRLSFRETATELGFTQSAISQQIAALESRVGARLVERGQGARGVSLTPTGELLLTHVDAILARLKIADQELARRPVRIGIFQSVSSTVVPAALAGLDVEAELVEADGGVALVRAGQIDLCFTEAPPQEAGVKHVELFEDPYMLLVPADDPRPAGTVVELDALRSLPVLTFRSYRSTCHFGAVERALGAKGFRFQQVLANDDAPTLHGLVAEGVAPAIIPRLAVNAGDGRVRALPLDPLIPARRICLAWDAERPPSERIAALVAAFKHASSPFRIAA